MPDPWMPGLRHDPGRSAGYNAGANRMVMAVDHWTGGTNSYNVCKWGREGYNAGLCQVLFPKVGIPWQFCEINAICYHAGSAAYGDYNDDGPGFEVERLPGEPLTADQTYWLGRVFGWLQSEWRLPDVHYWGPRFPWWGANFNGHVNHADIHPNDDGLSIPEWGQIHVGGSSSSEDDDMAKDQLYISKKSDPKVGIFVTDGVWKRWVSPDEWAFWRMFNPGGSPLPLSDQWWDSYPTAR